MLNPFNTEAIYCGLLYVRWLVDLAEEDSSIVMVSVKMKIIYSKLFDLRLT